MSETANKYKVGPNKPKVEPSSPPPPPPPKPVVAAGGEDWRSMDTAPKDGNYIYLLGDTLDPSNEATNEWYWYRTRQFRKGVWQPVGWWRRRFGPAVVPSFVPSGWRSIKEGLPK